LDFQVIYKNWNRQQIRDEAFFEVQGTLVVDNGNRMVNADLIRVFPGNPDDDCLLPVGQEPPAGVLGFCDWDRGSQRAGSNFHLCFPLEGKWEK